MGFLESALLRVNFTDGSLVSPSVASKACAAARNLKRIRGGGGVGREKPYVDTISVYYHIHW